MTTSTTPSNAWQRFLDSAKPRLREWKYGVYRLRQSKLALVGLALVLFYAVVAMAAPLLAEPDYADNPFKLRVSFRDKLVPPGSDDYLFGTGRAGVDIYQGVVWGARISMAMGLGVTLVGALIGTLLGGAAGYFGKWVDEAVMRVTDVFLAMPVLILAMAMSVAIPNDVVRSLLVDVFGMARGTAGTFAPLIKLSLALVVVWWPSYTRLVRGVVLSIRENQYVEAARAVGASDWRIITRHVLPNSLSPILVQATLDIGTVVLLAAALSFIGFGVGGSNFAEWGTLVSLGQNDMQAAWWPVTIPGLAIFGFVLGFNLLGDGLRDLLDPRLRK